MDYSKLLIAILVLWGIQVFLTYRQYRYINKNITEMTSKYHSGYLGVGKSTAKFRLGSGAIIIVVVDMEDRIQDILYMTGISLFTKFKQMKEYIGLKLSEVHSTDSKFIKAFSEANNNIEIQKNT